MLYFCWIYEILLRSTTDFHQSSRNKAIFKILHLKNRKTGNLPGRYRRAQTMNALNKGVTMNMQTPNKGYKDRRQFKDFVADLHFLVCFLRVSTSPAWQNRDGGMFWRRNLPVRLSQFFCILEVPLGPLHFWCMEGALGRITYLYYNNITYFFIF